MQMGGFDGSLAAASSSLTSFLHDEDTVITEIPKRNKACDEASLTSIKSKEKKNKDENKQRKKKPVSKKVEESITKRSCSQQSEVSTHEYSLLEKSSAAQEVSADPVTKRDAKFVGSYEGETIDGGLRNGQGKLVFSNGDVYTGEFLKGMRHGRGQLVYAVQTKLSDRPQYGRYDRRQYEGEFRHSKRHGHGSESWPSGEHYVGDYEYDKFHGYGEHRTLSGKYIGTFHQGYKQGKGTMTWLSGASYTGEWLNNRFHGAGTYTWADDSSYQGHWVHGLRHGFGIYTQPNGQKYMGNYQDGKRHGRGTIRERNGRCRDGIFKNDHLVNWTSKEYHGNNNIAALSVHCNNNNKKK